MRTLWVNRLIGDAQPDAKKIVWTSSPTHTAKAPLRFFGIDRPGWIPSRDGISDKNSLEKTLTQMIHEKLRDYLLSARRFRDRINNEPVFHAVDNYQLRLHA